eukprot:2576169-Prymnesium_polylepis.1
MCIRDSTCVRPARAPVAGEARRDARRLWAIGTAAGGAVTRLPRGGVHRARAPARVGREHPRRADERRARPRRLPGPAPVDGARGPAAWPAVPVR